MMQQNPSSSSYPSETPQQVAIKGWRIKSWRTPDPLSRPLHPDVGWTPAFPRWLESGTYRVGAVLLGRASSGRFGSSLSGRRHSDSALKKMMETNE